MCKRCTDNSDTVVNYITGPLYRVNSKNIETNCSRGKSVLVLRHPQFKKTPVFKRLRNDRSDGASVTTGRRLFQARTCSRHGKRTVAERLQVGLTTRVGESAYLKVYVQLMHASICFVKSHTCS